MKKIILLLTAMCVISVTLLSGCLYGNDRSDTAYIEPQQSENEDLYDLSVFSYYYYALVLDKVNNEFRFEEDGTRQEDIHHVPEAVVLNGSDFARYSTDCSPEYENLPVILTERYEVNRVEYIQYYAVEYGGTAYGFCNLYSSATGYLSGGGHIDVKKVIAGVYFKYDAEKDEFTELDWLDRCCLVAFDEQSVIYIKDRKYYAYTPGGEEKYICDDEAYDTGITNHSYVITCFNGEHCIIIMYRKNNKQYTKIVMVDYDGNVLLSEKK